MRRILPRFSLSIILLALFSSALLFSSLDLLSGARLDASREEQSKLEKRSAVDEGPPTECGQLGNTVPVCRPNASDIWSNDGTSHAIVWNPSHPLLAQSDAVDIYLIYSQNLTYNSVLTWFDVSSNPLSLVGYLKIIVNDSWFPASLGLGPLAPGRPNQTFSYFVQIVPSGQPSWINDSTIQAQNIATSANFTAMEIASLSATSSTPTPSQTLSTPTPSQTTVTSSSYLASVHTTVAAQNMNNANLPLWQISLIAVAGMALVIALVAATFAYRVRRRMNAQKSDDYGGGSMRAMLGSPSMAMTDDFLGPPSRSYTDPTPPSPSISSTAPLFIQQSSGAESRSVMSVSSFEKHGGAKVGPWDPDDVQISLSRPMSTPSQNIEMPPLRATQTMGPVVGGKLLAMGNAPTNSLSSTDARLIAETFRQRMRRPEWNKDEDEESLESGIANEKTRREVGERLLKEELAEEGKSLRSVLQRTPTVDESVDKADELGRKESKRGLK